MENNKVVRFVVGTLIVLFLLIYIFPFYWMVATSVKDPSVITKIPPDMYPKSFYFSYYRRVFTDYHLWEYIKNSLIVSGVTTVATVVVGAMAAYSFARIDIRGKIPLLLSILAVSMFPSMAVLAPLFLMIRKLGLMNTRLGLVLPYISFMLPLTVWVLTNFFREIPAELEEAAEIDGCTPVQAFIKIIAPLAVPRFFTMLNLHFISAWNEFLVAYVLATNRAAQTVPVGIMLIQGEWEFPWGEMSAASVTVTVPIIFLVLILQKKIIQGLTAGAIKG